MSVLRRLEKHLQRKALIENLVRASRTRTP